MLRMLSFPLAIVTLLWFAGSASCQAEDAPTTDPRGPGELSIGPGDCLKLQAEDPGGVLDEVDAGDDAGDAGDGGAP